MKVLLLSRYGNLGVTSRIRFFQYLPYLKQARIDVTVAPFLEDDYVRDLYARRGKNLGPIAAAYLRRINQLFTVRRFDLIWVEKEVLPWMPAFVELALRKMGIPYVVDYDDAIFHKYEANTNPLVRLFLGRKIDAVMQRSTMVIAGSHYLADKARQSGARQVEYVPTSVDLQRYHVPQEPPAGVFTIGWIGNPWTARYLSAMRHVFAEVCRDNRARVVFVGSGPIEMNGIPASVRDWSETTEVREIGQFDVGIMPIPDEPWERGKCGYKLIQYMACGRPVVASPVGANERIVEHGVSGYLASQPAEWIDALTRLRDQPVLRKAMGVEGRKKVEAEYSVQINAPRLAGLLNEAYEHP